MLLTIETHVVSAGSVFFFLVRIGVAEIIWVLGAPLPIGSLLLLMTTFRLPTGSLPLLEPWVRVIPPTTERTPPPREHTFLLQQTSSGKTDWTGRPILQKSNVKRLRNDVPDYRSSIAVLHISDLSTLSRAFLGQRRAAKMDTWSR
jgi:hypothetical protein